MNYKLIDEMLNYKHEIYFLELAKPLQIEDAFIEANIPLPIDYFRLKDQVLKAEDQTFTILDFAEGMLKVLAMDKTFQYREKYLKFLEKCPTELLELVFQMAVDYKDKKDYLHALLVFKGLLQIFPEDEKVMYLYGCTALDYSVVSGEPEKQAHLEDVARLIFEKMVKEDIGRTYAYYQLGFIYNNKKSYDQAIEAFQFALSLITDELIRDDIFEHLPQIEDKRLFQKGTHALDHMQWHEALDYLIPLTERYDDWWDLFLAVGVCYRALNQLENAHLYLRKARAYNAEGVPVLYELAKLHMQWGNYTEAKDILAKALGHEPENVDLIESFAIVLNQLGEKPLAMRFLEQALTLAPGQPSLMILMEEWNGR